MEIERKYLVLHLPGPLESYPCRILEQGYLNTSPVVRIRRAARNIISLWTKNLMNIFLPKLTAAL